MLQCIQDMSVVDLLRAGALLVGFIAAVFGDQKGSNSIWLKADALMLALHIPGIIFPQLFMKMMIAGDYDDNLIFLTRPSIVSTVMVAVLYYLTIKDKDDASIGAWLIARTLTMIAISIIHFNGLDTLSKGSLHMTANRIPTLMIILTTLGHVIHLLRFQEFANEGRGSSAAGTSCTRFHLFVDVLLDFPFVMLFLMYPSDAIAGTGIKGTGPMHAFVSRLCVATCLTPFLFSLSALQGNSERDQRACLIVRFLGFLVLLPFDVYFQYTTGTWSEMTCCTSIQMVIMGVMTINSFVGAFYKPKAKTY
eukprot:GHVO01062871.1.p1 GENE.GHVO01062871.1~~GHVO01062871.1.p1  ORF type:complete len:307 (+),score=29.37 GHVO01062871.1:183-1103(+)